MRTERTDDAGPIYATAAGMPARYRLPEPEPLPPMHLWSCSRCPISKDMQETTQGIGGYEEEAEENASKGHEEEIGRAHV